MLFESDENKNSADKPKKRYIANLEEYVPIHCYNPKRGENMTQPAIDLERDPIDAEIAVLALSKSGTRVVAVYIIKKA